MLAVAVVAPVTLAARPAPAAPPPGVNVPDYRMFNAQLPMIIRSAIPEAQGRIDKVAFDAERYRVFLAGTKNNAVYVLDLASHKTVHAVRDVPEARDIIWQADPGRLIVACGGDGTVRTFLAHDMQGLKNNPAYKAEHTIQLAGEPTDLSLEADGQHVWVAHAMSLARIDLNEGKRVARVTLPGRPDGVVHVQTPAGPRVFANVPKPEPTDTDKTPRPMVVVIDPERAEIVDRWSLADAAENSALGVDDTGTRLFVVAREPALLLVLDTSNGKEVARLPVASDSDDVEFDVKLNRIYVPGGGGGGQITVVQRTPAKDEQAETYEVAHNEKTNVGCRTTVLAQSERLLLAASPAGGTDPPFIYVYLVGPTK